MISVWCSYYLKLSSCDFIPSRRDRKLSVSISVWEPMCFGVILGAVFPALALS